MCKAVEPNGAIVKKNATNSYCSIFSSGVKSSIDDEYKWAGVEDPKIMVTTSRDPSSRLKMFAKVCISVKVLLCG